MQAYSPLFARVYNHLWAGFARQVAPLLREFYEATSLGEANKSLLDLACGTGQLARYFLEHGYVVVGLDLSEHMLEYAAENNASYAESGHARFVHGDVADFSLPERFGLAASTYDSLNHLDSEAALRGCFRSVFAALLPAGVFIFDLNTRLGLQRWNAVHVQPDDEIFLVNRGIYDPPGPKAWTKITGFVRMDDGRYERFDETVFNRVFELERVREGLRDAGFREVHFARMQSLSTPLDDPEGEGRVFVVARK